MNFEDWIGHLREELQQDNPILGMRNNKWEVTDRLSLWERTGSRIFDSNLERYKEAACDVFRQVHPKFQVPAGERYMFMPEEGSVIHSDRIREGMAETLALLGNHSRALSNCSLHLPEEIAALTLRDVLVKADWKVWASLNLQLPVFAEASPNEYLACVERALNEKSSPLLRLFEQEGKGLYGDNYMTGLLWSLEVLAWQSDLLSRVSILLAELASHDPGGRWANRPINSLIAIFLPWFPQTHADIDIRIAAFKAIREDFPDVAWKLAIAMLPNQHQTTSGSYKPKWKDPLPDDWNPVVSNSEYQSQVLVYSDQVVELASGDGDKLIELIGNLDNLPKDQFSKMLELISQMHLADASRKAVWEKLSGFVRKHRKFSGAKWALPEEPLKMIDAVCDEIAPEDPKDLYAFWFDKDDFDLLDDEGDYKDQEKRLAAKREEIVEKLYGINGLSELIQFAKQVSDSFQVGFHAAKYASVEDESVLLPDFLVYKAENPRNFIQGFIAGKLNIEGVAWVDGVDRSGWATESTLSMLLYMPFSPETWKRVSAWLIDDESEYWKRAAVNPYASEGELTGAIEKLLEVSRPNAALQCLEYMRLKEIPSDPTLVIRSLLEAITDDSEDHSLHDYYITSLISDLQNNPAVSADDLFKIEWAYLPLLEHSKDSQPKTITERLSADPEFFCEVIRLIFRSTKEEKKDEIDEERSRVASNAWRLLDNWKTVPGEDGHGNFDPRKFKEWYERVAEICRNTGHLEVARIKIGELLLNAPPDPEGLWINVEIARVLNHSDHEEMRRGFNTEVFNSRGAFWVDPEAKEEKELAALWNSRAQEVEKHGFARFAASLREISASYEREIQRRAPEVEADDGKGPDEDSEDS